MFEFSAVAVKSWGRQSGSVAVVQSFACIDGIIVRDANVLVAKKEENETGNWSSLSMKS